LRGIIGGLFLCRKLDLSWIDAPFPALVVLQRRCQPLQLFRREPLRQRGILEITAVIFGKEITQDGTLASV
jgi:hypothetical protein